MASDGSDYGAHAAFKTSLPSLPPPKTFGKPTAIAAALAERISIVDDAIAELTARLSTAAENAERTNRKRRAEAALEATRDRVKLAKAVDQALVDLATNWTVYTEALRKDVGQVVGAGGDVTAVERALTNNRTAEPLVKAMIQVGGLKLTRSLGIDTPIRERHASSLADAEGRVAESLQVELLRVQASSPSNTAQGSIACQNAA